jgi:hypothetical protein
VLRHPSAEGEEHHQVSWLVTSNLFFARRVGCTRAWTDTS